MCGIVGIVRLDEQQICAETFHKALISIRHRGPDGLGHHIDGNIALGNSRLSIVDHAGGTQPMRRYGAVISYNGELYNAGELRSELGGLGYQFTTRSDTEVVLAAWRHYGTECVRHFRGMFAFAIIDKERNTLFAARDQFGIKPFQYYIDEKVFIFASETQAILPLLEKKQDIDTEAIDLFMAFGYIPAPRTIYKSIRKLVHGHTLEYSLRDRSVRRERYYSLPLGSAQKEHCADVDALLEDTLLASVKRHLTADVPFGALLSGGVDSTIVALLMSRLSEDSVSAFSIGFDDREFDELGFSRYVADTLGISHVVETLSVDSAAAVRQLMVNHGEPFADASSIPSYHLAALARREVPMVLSGDGADEAFGGYPSHLNWIKLRDGLGCKYDDMSLEEKVRLWCETSIGRIAGIATRRSLWKPEYQALPDTSIDAFTESFCDSADYSPLDQARYLDFASYLPNWIFAKQDIASMSHGLEVRPPFADVEVIDFVSKMPSSQILKKNHEHFVQKYALKSMLSKHFSEDFVFRKKQGFVPPIERWLQDSSEFGQIVRGKILSKDARLNEYFQHATLETLCQSELQYHWNKIWALFVLETWLTDVYQ